MIFIINLNAIIMNMSNIFVGIVIISLMTTLTMLRIAFKIHSEFLFEQLSKDIKLEYPKQFLIKTASNFVKLKFRDIDKEKNKNFSMNQTDFDIPH